MKVLLNKYESVFKALSDSIRLNIIKELNKQDSICVCDLAGYFDIPQSKLSYHLKMLLDASLIIKEREGKWNYYKINRTEIEKYISKEAINCILEIEK